MNLTEKQKEIFKRAVTTWGAKSQILCSIEEMAELTKELIKNINRGKDNINDIIEEVADVLIMLYQVQLAFGIEDEVIKAIASKSDVINNRLA